MGYVCDVRYAVHGWWWFSVCLICVVYMLGSLRCVFCKSLFAVKSVIRMGFCQLCVDLFVQCVLCV